MAKLAHFTYTKKDKSDKTLLISDKGNIPSHYFPRLIVIP